MVNIRGLKCKEGSVKEIIEEEEPTIMIIMETMSNEKLEIKGYGCRKEQMCVRRSESKMADAFDGEYPGIHARNQFWSPYTKCVCATSQCNISTKYGI